MKNKSFRKDVFQDPVFKDGDQSEVRKEGKENSHANPEVKKWSESHIQLFAMEFSRPEYWSG